MLQDEMVVVVEVPEVDVVVEEPPDITVIPKTVPDVIVLAAGGLGQQGPPGEAGEDGESISIPGIADGEFPVWDATTSSWIRSTADLVKIAEAGMLIDTILLHKVAADALQVDVRKFRIVGPQGDVMEINNAGLWAYFGLEAAYVEGQVSGAGFVLDAATPLSTWDIYTQSNKDGVIFWNGVDRFRFGTDGMWFEPDVRLYRALAGVLKIDGSFWAVADIVANQGGSAQMRLGAPGGLAGLTFGSAEDTTLYRAAAGVLKTPGRFEMSSGFSSYVSDGVFAAEALTSKLFTPGNAQLLFGYQDAGFGQYYPSLGFLALAGAPYVGYLEILQTRLASQGHNRFAISHDGTLKWGSGAAPPDLSFYRGGPGHLKSDDISILQGASNYDFRGQNDVYVSTLGVGNSITLRNLVTAAQLRLKPDGKLVFSTSEDTNIYRVAPGHLKTDGIFEAVGKITDSSLPYRLLPHSPFIYDYNTAVNTGWYKADDTAANRPPVTTAYMLVEVIAWDGYNVTQTAYHLYSDEVWSRRMFNGNFTAWTKIYPTNINDSNLPRRIASGTGEPGFLDADLLLENGWHYLAGSSANAPTADQFHVNVIAYGPGHLVQVAYAMLSDKVFIRRKFGTWASWTQIYPSSGGGVDYIGNWAAPTPYKKGDVVRYNGVDYLAVNDSTGQTPPATSPMVGGIGTSFPASPFDGQAFTLVDSLTAPTYSWHFRYVASITDAYKWVFIGGAPINKQILTAQTPSGPNIWTNLGTVGPDFIVPRAGIYQSEATCRIYNGSSGSEHMHLGVANASLTSTPVGPQNTTTPPAGYYGNLNVVTQIAATAGQTLRMQYYSTSALGQFSERSMLVLPVRLS